MHKALAVALLLSACVVRPPSVFQTTSDLASDSAVEAIVREAHDQEPTTEHPKVGCIAPTMAQQAQVSGKLLPEPVRIIGVTSPADGQRWKVLRAGVYDQAKWIPMSKSAVRFVNCGAETDSVRQVFAPQRGGRQ